MATVTVQAHPGARAAPGPGLHRIVLYQALLVVAIFVLWEFWFAPRSCRSTFTGSPVASWLRPGSC